MKNSKKWIAILLILSTLFVCGCGTKVNELTDEERDMVVSYSASVIAKYNTYQKDGITVVDKASIDAALAPEEIQPEDTQTDDTQADETQTEENQTEDPQQVTIPDQPSDLPSEESAISLAEALGVSDAILITYGGFEVADSYTDGHSADEPAEGKVYVILKFTLQTTADTSLNLVTDGPKFYLSDESVSQIANTSTLMGADLSTFLGKDMKAGFSKDVVVLFEMTAEQAQSVANPILTMKYNNQTNRIKL